MTQIAATLNEYIAHVRSNTDPDLSYGPAAIAALLAEATADEESLVAQLLEAFEASPVMEHRDEILGLLNGWFD